jgi:hypothetical protein
MLVYLNENVSFYLGSHCEADRYIDYPVVIIGTSFLIV